MTAQPNVTLTIANVPPHCRRARIALLGPLTQQDLDAESFVSHQQGERLQAFARAKLPTASGKRLPCETSPLQVMACDLHCMHGVSCSETWAACGLAGWWDLLTGFRQQVGLMAQGQQRHLDPSGRVQALQKPSPDLLVGA